MYLSEVSSLCVHDFGNALSPEASERVRFGAVLWEVDCHTDLFIKAS